MARSIQWRENADGEANNYWTGGVDGEAKWAQDETRQEQKLNQELKEIGTEQYGGIPKQNQPR